MNLSDIKINWQFHLYSMSSMSFVARQMALAMAEIGCQVKVTPLDSVKKDGVLQSDEESKLLSLAEKDIKEEDFYHVKFSPEDALAEIKKGKNIAMRIWSFDPNSVPKDLVKAINSQFTGFWTCSQHCLNAFINVGLYKEKGFIVPHGVDTTQFHLEVAKKLFPTKKSFKFLFVGLPIARKGLEVLLPAYMEEFSPKEDVCLVVMTRPWNKQYTTRCLELGQKSRPDGDYPEVLLISEDIPHYEMPAYYAGCDCYIDPARTEAFGLCIVEAMACGLPVIVTRWGGPVDFCNRKNSYLLDYTLAPAYNELPGFSLPDGALWAEPDKEQLKSYMRYVFENREEAKEKGFKAHQDITSQWTWIKAAEKAAESIQALEADNPNLLS